MALSNPDAQEISELLETVSTKLPLMITNILKTVYSEEAGRNVGRAVGTLYRERLAAGIPSEMALEMASDYMVSFKDLLGSMDLGEASSASRAQAPSEAEPQSD